MSVDDMAQKIAAAYSWPLDETAAGVAWYLGQIGLAGTKHLDKRSVARFRRVYSLM